MLLQQDNARSHSAHATCTNVRNWIGSGALFITKSQPRIVISTCFACWTSKTALQTWQGVTNSACHRQRFKNRWLEKPCSLLKQVHDSHRSSFLLCWFVVYLYCERHQIVQKVQKSYCEFVKYIHMHFINAFLLNLLTVMYLFWRCTSFLKSSVSNKSSSN